MHGIVNFKFNKKVEKLNLKYKGIIETDYIVTKIPYDSK